MKKILLTILGLTAIAAMTVHAQPGTSLRPDETVLLYATKFSDGTDPVRAKKIVSAGYEMVESNCLTGPEAILDNGNLSNISEYARFDLYFPEKPDGRMIVVCPGGGYSIVSSYNEGVYVADWMLERGITVAVVKYRLPNGHHNVPLEDVQNTFRYCRLHAPEWGVDRIGIMGFSAGGHLAVTAALMYEDETTRPDFNIFIYPVVTMDLRYTHLGTHDELLGSKAEAEERGGKSWDEWVMGRNLYGSLEEMYSLERQTSPDTAPTFITLCSDDGAVAPENSLRLYRSLIADKVPVEMHIYPQGGHGWGFSAEKYVGEGNDWFSAYRDSFLSELDRWLRGVSE